MGIEHSEEEQVEANPSGVPGLKRSLSVRAAAALSLALMARKLGVALAVRGEAS